MATLFALLIDFFCSFVSRHSLVNRRAVGLAVATFWPLLQRFSTCLSETRQPSEETGKRKPYIRWMIVYCLRECLYLIVTVQPISLLCKSQGLAVIVQKIASKYLLRMCIGISAVPCYVPGQTRQTEESYLVVVPQHVTWWTHFCWLQDQAFPSDGMHVASHVQIPVLEIKHTISPLLLVKDAVTQHDHECGSVEDSQLAGETGILGTNLAQCPF